MHTSLDLNSYPAETSRGAHVGGLVHNYEGRRVYVCVSVGTIAKHSSPIIPI